MSNNARTRDRLPYNFVDGLKVKGIDIDSLISTNVTQQLSNKQDTLISGTNIKTINGVSILGGGDIATREIPVKYLTDFGALGDGLTSSVTENNAAIQLALQHIANTGHSVMVPEGTYICDPFVITNIAYSRQGTFIGIDRERCVFKRNTTGIEAFITIGNESSPSFQAGMGMSNIKIDGGATTNGPALRMYDVVRSRFEYCQFSGGNIACDVLGGISITFATCLFDQAAIGVKINKFISSAGGGWPNSIHFEGGEMVDNSVLGMWVDCARMISISHIDVEGNGTTPGLTGQGGIYVGPNIGQEVSINDTFSIGLVVESCWFESNRGLADIHIASGITSIDKTTFFSSSSQTTNDINVEGGRYSIRDINMSFAKTHNLYENTGAAFGNIVMCSDIPGIYYDPIKTTIHGRTEISMRGGSVPVLKSIIQPLIQFGSDITDGSGNLNVTFETPYRFVPAAITCTPVVDETGSLYSCSVTGSTVNGFTAKITYINQTITLPAPGTGVEVSWITIGSEVSSF